MNILINEMFSHMKMRIENPALANIRFTFNEVAFIDINFHQLNLTRGSSFLPIPDWIVKKKAVIKPKNENDEEFFKWAIIAALPHVDIKSNTECMSNLRKYDNDYDWSGLEFPVAMKGISKFEKNNNFSINILGLEGKNIQICRKTKYKDQKKVINLLLIDNGGRKQHYTAISIYLGCSHLVIVGMNVNSISL